MAPVIRSATRDDLPRLVELLAQLSLDSPREDLRSPRPAAYDAALEEVLADGRQTLLVAEVDGAIVGMACYIEVPNLSHVGRPYALVEDVVVAAAMRGQGYGEALMQRAIELARAGGCYKLVLTSSKVRTDAHRFYQRLGFKATHVGFRLDL
jgi:GNAT superfamily N-acetyltransferase